LEFRNEISSSSIRFVKLRLSIVPGHEEDWSSVLVSFMDITRDKETERELEASLREKDELMRELRDGAEK
jgi:hypothetical protein